MGLGLTVSKNKRIKKETEDPFMFTLVETNCLELNSSNIKKEDQLFLKLIVAHEDINQRNSLGETLLHIAASRGYVHSCRLLLRRQAVVDAVDNIGQTPLFISCHNNHSKVIKLLLNYGADPNILTPRCGVTPLHALCCMFHCFRFYPHFKPDPTFRGLKKSIQNAEEVNQRTVYCKPEWGCKDVKLLIQHGADINQRNVYGETALHYCCTNGTAEMMELLIKKRADINCRDKGGSSPLQLSIRSAPFGTLRAINTVLYKVEILINAGADLSINNSNGDSHYHLILQKIGSNPDLYQPMLSFFLNHDPKLDMLNTWGQNCLHVFNSGGCSVPSDIVKHIVHGGISVNSTDHFGNTPIHYLWYHREALESLMEAGGDINVRNNLGQTPLQNLNRSRLDEACDVISKYKAKVDSRDNMGKSLLHYFMIYLIDHVHQNAGIILLLLNGGCNVNTQDHTGTSCLHIRCMDILLEQPDVDVNIRDYFGSTPLHLAAWEGRADCVKKLLSASGIDVNIHDINNRTALDAAAQRCHLHIIDLFPDIEKSKKSSIGPHLRIDAISGDIHTCIGYDEIELVPFLQECLECPDLGNIWTEEATTIRTEVDIFVKNLVKEVTVRDPRFEMEVLLSGSVSEETKCGLPDEFDYLMILTRFSDICNIAPDSCVHVPRPGYVSLRCNESCPPDYERYFEFMTSEIMKMMIRDELSELLRSILCLKLFTSCKQLQVESSLKLEGPSLEIPLTWRGAFFKNLPVKIDFVPVLKFPNWCPDNLNVHSSRLLTPSAIQEVGCDVTLLKLVTVNRELFAQITSPLCRISCSRLEHLLFQTMNPEGKKGYILAKCMLLLKQYDPISNKMVQGKYSRIIKSYMLKTALFYILDNYAAKGVNKYSAIDVCEGIYDYIFNHTFPYQSGKMYIRMATYFMSDVFIESDTFEPDEKKLTFGLQLHSMQGIDKSFTKTSKL